MHFKELQTLKEEFLSYLYLYLQFFNPVVNQSHQNQEIFDDLVSEVIRYMKPNLSSRPHHMAIT